MAIYSNTHIILLKSKNEAEGHFGALVVQHLNEKNVD